jgi:hypothetical protein
VFAIDVLKTVKPWPRSERGSSVGTPFHGKLVVDLGEAMAGVCRCHEQDQLATGVSIVEVLNVDCEVSEASGVRLLWLIENERPALLGGHRPVCVWRYQAWQTIGRACPFVRDPWAAAMTTDATTTRARQPLSARTTLDIGDVFPPGVKAHVGQRP